MMTFIIERKAMDWQCDCDCSDWDGWQEFEKFNDKFVATQKAKQLRKEDEDSEYRVVKG